MTAQILDGKAIAADIREQVRRQVEARGAAGQDAPGLVVVLVGENPASQVYVRNKQRACQQVGFRSELLQLPADTSQARLLELIEQLNARDDVDGITFRPTKTDAYTLINLHGSYDLDPHWQLFGKIDNLLDTDYELASRYNTPGRTLSVGIRYDTD